MARKGMVVEGEPRGREGGHGAGELARAGEPEPDPGARKELLRAELVRLGEYVVPEWAARECLESESLEAFQRDVLLNFARRLRRHLGPMRRAGNLMEATKMDSASLRVGA
jgi:hypothetical protein